jgi:hypothetical protein
MDGSMNNNFDSLSTLGESNIINIHPLTNRSKPLIFKNIFIDNRNFNNIIE